MWLFSKQKKVLSLSEITKILDGFYTPFAYVSTPNNLKEEKNKFLNSDTYEPIFKYNKLPSRNGEILAQLASVELIKDVDPRISDYYIKLIAQKNISNELYKGIGNNEAITKYSIEKFGFPGLTTFNNAVLVLKGKTSNYNLKPMSYKKESEIADSEKIVSTLEYFLKEYGFEDFKVIFSARETSGVRVGVHDKEVVVGSNDIKRKNFDLRKLVVHEIGTHMFRYFNGSKTGIPALGKVGTIDSILTEEGLASYNEEYMQLLSVNALKRKARPIYATYLGKDLSFRQLYNVLRGFVPKESAFKYCFRVKRGLGDMSKPGIYTKDIVYFKGYRKVRKAIAKDSSIHRKLFAGKISLDQISWVDDGLIPKPKLVIDPEKFNKTFEKLGI